MTSCRPESSDEVALSLLFAGIGVNYIVKLVQGSGGAEALGVASLHASQLLRPFPFLGMPVDR